MLRERLPSCDKRREILARCPLAVVDGFHVLCEVALEIASSRASPEFRLIPTTEVSKYSKSGATGDTPSRENNRERMRTQAHPKY